MSLLPVGPTVSRVAAYLEAGKHVTFVVKEEFSDVHLTAMDMQALAPPTLMLAMQILPESS